jgi:sugar phosphate isomerase/epimerase
MTLRLATADYTFPKLEWEQSLRLARDLGFDAIDIGLFAGRSHLRPENLLAQPAQAAAQIVAALQAHGLAIADIFGQPGNHFEEKAVNHPDAGERKQAAEFFGRILELVARCSGKHLSLLPGVHFEREDYEDSLHRCADELAWRVEAALRMGIALAVEPHVGSIVQTPVQTRHLLDRVPGLTLTLDYGHFTCQGIPDDEIEPLLGSASHFHARCGCKGKLQAGFEENAIDYRRILGAMKRVGYGGHITLEYVWTEWMQCNRVDNVSETILLRDFLRGANGNG